LFRKSLSRCTLAWVTGDAGFRSVIPSSVCFERPGEVGKASCAEGRQGTLLRRHLAADSLTVARLGRFAGCCELWLLGFWEVAPVAISPCFTRDSISGVSLAGVAFASLRRSLVASHVQNELVWWVSAL